MVVRCIAAYAISAYPSGEVYSIQHYVIKFVSDLRQVWLSSGTPVSSTNNTVCRDIIEILLKVELDT